MNINYEINKLVNNKYNYRNDETPTCLFIFEIELIDTNYFSHFIRKIIKDYTGSITIDLLYNDIIKYNLIIIDINKMDNIIMIKGHFNNNKTVNNNITINFLKSFDNRITCNYLL
jgi:hypothetical protein